MGVALLHKRNLRPSNLPAIGGAFADYTWAEVSAICKAGRAASYFNVGDSRYVYPDAESVELKIAGFNHDSVADSVAYGRSKAGITLMATGAISTLRGAMNDHNYTGTTWYNALDEFHCLHRKTNIPNFMSGILTNDLRSVLVPVVKDYMLEDGTFDTVVDTVFYPSVKELTGATAASGAGGEGRQYMYFANGGSFARDYTTWTRSKDIEPARWLCISDSDSSINGISVIFNSIFVIYGTDYYGWPFMCI